MCRRRTNELARFLTIGPTLVHAYFSITFSIQYPERGKETRGEGWRWTGGRDDGGRRGVTRVEKQEKARQTGGPSARLLDPRRPRPLPLARALVSSLSLARTPGHPLLSRADPLLFLLFPPACHPLYPSIAAANRFVIVFVSAVVAADGVSGVISRTGG